MNFAGAVSTTQATYQKVRQAITKSFENVSVQGQNSTLKLIYSNTGLFNAYSQEFVVSPLQAQASTLLAATNVTEFLDQVQTCAEMSPYLGAAVDAIQASIDSGANFTFMHDSNSHILANATLYGFALHRLTTLIFSDHNVLKAIVEYYSQQSFIHKAEIAKVFSPFELAKFAGRDRRMLLNVGLLTYKQVPATLGRWELPITILEAAFENQIGPVPYQANARVGVTLALTPGGSAVRNNKTDAGPTHLSEAQDDMLVFAPFPEKWADLYGTWNMAFVSQYRNFPFHLAKLLNPAVFCFHGRSPTSGADYLYRRNVALYIHSSFLAYSRRSGANLAWLDMDWSDSNFTQVWGDANQKSANSYEADLQSADPVWGTWLKKGANLAGQWLDQPVSVLRGFSNATFKAFGYLATQTEIPDVSNATSDPKLNTFLGHLGNLQETPPQPKELKPKYPALTVRPKRFAIIGAGPAGTHMAFRLKQKGYNDVTVFEKTGRVGGKVYTVKHADTPHELGACYTHGGYRTIRDLMEYFKLAGEPVPPRDIIGSPLHPTSGVSMAQFAIEFMSATYGFDPSTLAAKLTQAAFKYVVLHGAIFGEFDPYTMFHSPMTDAQLKLTNMTILEFLTQNDLLVLEPLFLVAQTAQGYGYLDKMPAFYGLMWISPSAMQSALSQVSGSASPGVVMVKEGFSALIDKLVEDAGSEKFQLDATILTVNRSDTKVAIKWRSSSGETREDDFDWLINTAWLDKSPSWIDLRPEEVSVFSKLTHLGIASTVFTAETMPDDYAITSWFNHLQSDQPNKLATVRHSVQVVRPGATEALDTRVTIQLTDPTKSDTYVFDTLTNDLQTLFNATKINYLDQFNTPYLAYFPTREIMNRRPWQVQELQGKFRTWYGGASASFESVNNVMLLNNDLLESLPDNDDDDQRKINAAHSVAPSLLLAVSVLISYIV